MIRWKQKDMDFADFGLKFGNPDFVKLAEAFGANGHRVESAEGFAKALKAALDGKGVHVIDLPVDYSKTNAALGAELRAGTELI